MGALLLRQSGTNFDGRNNKRRNNKDMVDDLLSEFEPPIRSARVEGVFRAVDRGVYYDKQEGDETDPYGKSPWNPPYSNLHLSSSQIYATVVEALNLQPGMSFLNLGSGSGYLSTLVGLLIGPNGLNHGIELHTDVVDYAYKRLEQFKQTSSAIDRYDFAEPIFINGNFLNFNPSHRYDRVYLGAQCLPDALRFVMQLVKPGGGILVTPYEENLMRYVRLSETKWHSESLMNVIFTTMIGLGPVVGHDGELREQRMIEIPLCSTKSLKELCRIVIRQQLRLKTERVHPELPNSDNLDRRRELRRRQRQRRLRLREEAQERQLQSDCMRCRRESWRSTAGIRGELPANQEDELDKCSSPESLRRRLLSRLRNMETGSEGCARRGGTNRNQFLNRPRQASDNRYNRGRLPIDYADDDDDEEDWSFSLRSHPRRLFNRPLGGASSARPFRDITFEDILSGRPPLSELMRYRPASPSRRPSRAMRQAIEGDEIEEVVEEMVEQMMDFEPQLESSRSSSFDDSSSSPSSSSSSSSSSPSLEDEDNNAMPSESDSNSEWDSDSESDNIIIVDSGGDDGDDERQVSARETRLRGVWSDFFRGLEPTEPHWLASSEDDDDDDDDGGKEEPRHQRVNQPVPGSRATGNLQGGQRGRPEESASISCRLRSRARNAVSLLVSGDNRDEQQASRSINSATTHDSFTSGGPPLTRGAARAMPYQHRAQVAWECPPAAATNCPPQTLTSMSDAAHQPFSFTSAERKRKRQSSSSSSSSEQEREEGESSSSLSLCDHAAPEARPSQRRCRRRSRCTRATSTGHLSSSASASLLGHRALTSGQVAGGTSVAIDSRGVMSTMTTRVIMPCAAAAAVRHQDGVEEWRIPRRRRAGPRLFSSPFVDAGANNNDNNEQVPQTPAAAANPRRPLTSEVCALRLAESDHSQTGNVHSHRDCEHRRSSPGAAWSRHFRGVRVERQRRVRDHQTEGRRPHTAATRNLQLVPSANISGRSSESPPKLSECESYRSYMSASIRRLPVPNVLRDYLNHERDF